jgi:nitrogen fixation NifU-like protein
MTERKKMTDEEFDAFVDKMQGEVFAETLDAYGEKGFQRWRHPQYHGRMNNADGYGCVTGGCGDTIEMFLKVEGSRVADASYTTTGCSSSSLCGSFTAELVIGRELEQVFDLQGDDILNYIGTFPEKERHCAFLAVESLHEAANDHLVRTARKAREPVLSD